MRWTYEEEDIKNLLFPAFDVVELILDNKKKTITAEIKTRNAVNEIKAEMARAAEEVKKQSSKKEKDASGAMFT